VIAPSSGFDSGQRTLGRVVVPPRPSPASWVARGRSTHLPTTYLRLSPLAGAGTSRGAPAAHAIQITRPAQGAGLKEEN
jgi:hypothetical protein